MSRAFARLARKPVYTLEYSRWRSYLARVSDRLRVRARARVRARVKVRVKARVRVRVRDGVRVRVRVSEVVRRVVQRMRQVQRGDHVRIALFLRHLFGHEVRPIGHRVDSDPDSGDQQAPRARAEAQLLRVER